MSIGMSWHDYWYGDVRMVEAYREAHKEKCKQFNAQAHLQAMYFYEALCDVSPVFHAFARKGTKPLEFRAQPYSLFEKEELTPRQKEIQEKNEEQFARAYMMQMDMVGKKWGNQ